MKYAAEGAVVGWLVLIAFIVGGMPGEAKCHSPGVFDIWDAVTGFIFLGVCPVFIGALWGQTSDE